VLEKRRIALKWAPLAGATIAALALVACGGDDDGETSSSAASETEQATGGSAVEVVAEDIGFTEDSYSAEPGTIEVTYRNSGSVNHTLVIEDVDGFKLEVNSNGDEDSGTVELEEGTYTIYCDVPGHRGAGMEATLEVG
jgi:plastocyanin